MYVSFFLDKSEELFGYIEGRSCEIAVETLKRTDKRRLKGTILVTLDASGSFENVSCRAVFAAKNAPPCPPPEIEKNFRKSFKF